MAPFSFNKIDIKSTINILKLVKKIQHSLTPPTLMAKGLEFVDPMLWVVGG